MLTMSGSGGSLSTTTVGFGCSGMRSLMLSGLSTRTQPPAPACNGVGGLPVEGLLTSAVFFWGGYTIWIYTPSDLREASSFVRSMNSFNVRGFSLARRSLNCIPDCTDMRICSVSGAAGNGTAVGRVFWGAVLGCALLPNMLHGMDIGISVTAAGAPSGNFARAMESLTVSQGEASAGVMNAADFFHTVGFCSMDACISIDSSIYSKPLVSRAVSTWAMTPAGAAAPLYGKVFLIKISGSFLSTMRTV